jgi:hypothetical protein
MRVARWLAEKSMLAKAGIGMCARNLEPVKEGLHGVNLCFGIVPGADEASNGFPSLAGVILGLASAMGAYLGGKNMSGLVATSLVPALWSS